MEGHFAATREELYHVQMDIKHVQAVQISHADRLLRLEKRQADDAALKSVWTSPFPSVMGGTPQQGPVTTPSAEVFEDFDDEHGQNLLGSLQLGADEEPVRRGASRANSVRFDVSAIQGSNWAQGSRSSGEFAPARPTSGFGSHPMTERSLSHKSDGRHSSAGHSIHSIHSAPSGRTSSLGLDANFIIGGQDDNSLLDIPEPPPGLFILGSVPSIIRCWLNENFSHSALLYAVVCTGSQKSQLDFSLVRELGFQDLLQKDGVGRYTIRLPVYLPEAIITQPTSRTNSPAPQLPTLTANFEVVGMNKCSSSEKKKHIQVFLGSDTLRAHSADILFSSNIMTLYGENRHKVSVPFVRPEDETLFQNLCTTNIVESNAELIATNLSYTSGDQISKVSPAIESEDLYWVSGPTTIEENRGTVTDDATVTLGTSNYQKDDLHSKNQTQGIVSEGKVNGTTEAKDTFFAGNASSDGAENEYLREQESSPKQSMIEAAGTGSDRRGSSSGIWGSWRNGGVSSADTDVNRENGSVSGYQRAGRGGRSMKILKPKSSQSGRSTSTARTGAAYEPPPPPRVSGEGRRKSQTNQENNVPGRLETKKTVSDDKELREIRSAGAAPRSSNPVGGASAFAWMNPTKSIVNAAGAE